MKNKIIPIIFLLLLFIPFVSADIISTDMKLKSISGCLKVTNIDSYPGYYFIDRYNLSNRPIIQNDDCFDIGHFLAIEAIKKSDYNNFTKFLFRDNITNTIGVTFESDQLLSRIAYTPVAAGLYNVPGNSPLTKYVVPITFSLQNGTFIAVTTNVIYYYSDGTSEGKQIYPGQLFPEPSKKALFPERFAELWYLIIPLTIILEFLVYWFFVKSEPLKLLLASTIINVITVPFANYFHQLFYGIGFISKSTNLGIFANTLYIELAIMLVESFIIKWFFGINYKKSLLISVVANLVSFILGTVLMFGVRFIL